jgi:hypothetical protein
LRQLSVCPVGQGLSSDELQGLLDMPQLQQLTLGLKDASEVSELLSDSMSLKGAGYTHCNVLVVCSAATAGACCSAAWSAVSQATLNACTPCKHHGALPPQLQQLTLGLKDASEVSEGIMTA